MQGARGSVVALRSERLGFRSVQPPPPHPFSSLSSIPVFSGLLWEGPPAGRNWRWTASGLEVSLVSLASRNHRSAEAITAALRTEASYHPFLCILTTEHAGCSSCCSLVSSPSQVSRVQPTVARPIELKHP